MATLVLRSKLGRSSDHSPNHFFSLDCGIAGCTQRRVIWQPNVQIKPILNILREELSLQARAEKSSTDEKNKRSGKNSPTVFYGSLDKRVIEPVEASLAPFLDGRFWLCRGTLNVVDPERGGRTFKE